MRKLSNRVMNFDDIDFEDRSHVDNPTPVGFENTKDENFWEGINWISSET